MGFKILDVAPVATNGPSATTPFCKDVVVKAFLINRTDTVASVKCVLPADATIIDIRAYSPAASNAGTTATISIGIPGTPGYFLNGVDVKTAAGKLTTTGATNLFNLENIPLGSDIQITGVYAETGTVSSAGGPFYITVEYVR
jgi:hypothetical protein